MKRKSPVAIIIVVLFLVTLSCQATNNSPSSTATSAPSIQTSPVIEEESTPTEDFSAITKEAQESSRATQEAASQATSQAGAEQAEATSAAATAEAEQILQLTAEVEKQATAQAQGMAQLVEQLVAEGTVDSINGQYYWMEDFNETWAQISWYQWWDTGIEPADFVISAHTEWESASKTANWFESGCGFVFHEQDADNHYMIFLALDGNVYLKGYVNGIYREFGKEYAGKIDHLKGGADIVLAVDGPRITYYVNGVKVLQRENEEIREGKLALTLVSGTNKDYGTRCEISNIEIWDMTGQ